MTAQLSASLGTESSQSWILHFSFSWVGFPSTSSSAWAVYCFPAVRGGFLVCVQHPSPHSGAAGTTRIKKPLQTTEPSSKALLEEHSLICWNPNIPRGGRRKLWQPRQVPAQQPRRGDAKLPFWEPHTGPAHPGRDCPRSEHCKTIWTLFFLRTVPRIWFWFGFSCQPRSSESSIFIWAGENPGGSVCIWFDSLQQFQFYVDRKSQRSRDGYFLPWLCQAHNPSCLKVLL